MIISKKVFHLISVYLLKYSIYCVFVSFVLSCNSSTELSNLKDVNSKDIKKSLSYLNTDSFYLAFRSGNGKESQMAVRYNVSDTTFSHVGLLVFNKKWIVVNIFSSENDPDFKLDTARSFFNPVDMNVKSCAIYEPIEVPDYYCMSNLIHVIDSFDKKRFDIKFDYKFNLENEKYYCSELVIELLTQACLDYSFDPDSRVLTELEGSFLGVDTLIYYPVDKLQCHSRFIQYDIW